MKSNLKKALILLSAVSLLLDSLAGIAGAETEPFDVIVDVEVTVKEDTDAGLAGDPDPQVVVRVGFTNYDPNTENRSGMATQSSEPVNGVAVGETAYYRFHFKGIYYGLYPSNAVRVDADVYDSDSFLPGGPTIRDDYMGGGNNNRLGDGQSTTISNSKVEIKITVKIVPFCTIVRWFPHGKRRIVKLENGNYKVETQIDVDPAAMPNSLETREIIPNGFTLESSSPPATVTTEGHDGFSYTVLKWNFTGSEVMDRTVYYIASPPANEGFYPVLGSTGSNLSPTPTNQLDDGFIVIPNASTIGSSGGSVSSDDSHVTWSVPPGAFGSNTNVSVGSIPTAFHKGYADASNFTLIGDVYELLPSGSIYQGGQRGTVTFTYPEGWYPSQLHIYRYNDSTGAWEQLPTSSYNTTNRTISALGDHNSIYGLGGEPAPVPSTSNLANIALLLLGGIAYLASRRLFSRPSVERSHG